MSTTHSGTTEVNVLTRFVLILGILMVNSGSVSSASQRSNFHVEIRSRATRQMEALSHYRVLFWNNQPIANNVEQVFISPSKRFALFRQNGGLFVADENRQDICVIAGGYVGIPDYVVWIEPSLQASLGLQGRPPAVEGRSICRPLALS
ncbi:MAG: hypothetical protein ACJ71Q_11920 [Terriglobales bacterium]|jgi:hypothetical protein